jgi:hypothetical protein
VSHYVQRKRLLTCICKDICFSKQTLSRGYGQELLAGRSHILSLMMRIFLFLKSLLLRISFKNTRHSRPSMELEYRRCHVAGSENKIERFCSYMAIRRAYARAMPSHSFEAVAQMRRASERGGASVERSIGRWVTQVWIQSALGVVTAFPSRSSASFNPLIMSSSALVLLPK